ncbi:hypothetical protein OH77DRAFT_1594608 [Trametes cingulata]|nr:hypothetical protein OH77DRAFT_1594608 [Trametes cingulata]
MVIPSSPSPCGRKTSVAPRTLDGFPREYCRLKAPLRSFLTSPLSPRTDRSSPRNRGSLPPLLHSSTLTLPPSYLDGFPIVPDDLTVVRFVWTISIISVTFQRRSPCGRSVSSSASWVSRGIQLPAVSFTATQNSDLYPFQQCRPHIATHLPHPDTNLAAFENPYAPPLGTVTGRQGGKPCYAKLKSYEPPQCPCHSAGGLGARLIGVPHRRQAARPWCCRTVDCSSWTDGTPRMFLFVCPCSPSLFFLFTVLVFILDPCAVSRRGGCKDCTVRVRVRGK